MVLAKRRAAHPGHHLHAIPRDVLRAIVIQRTQALYRDRTLAGRVISNRLLTP